MIHHLIDGTPTALLHLEGLPTYVQVELLASLRLELLDRDENRWEKPWGGGGSLDPAFVGWPRVIVESTSDLLAKDEGVPQLQRQHGFDTHHCWRTEDDRFVLIVKPRRRF